MGIDIVCIVADNRTKERCGVKTFEQKVIFGLVGGIVGFLIGWLVCAFVAGTMDPFAIHFYDTDNIRLYPVEGMARLFWVIVVGISSFCGGYFGVYLVGRK